MSSDTTSPQPDYDAFVRLFVRHERALRAFVRTLVAGADAAEDVMQETGIVAWRKFAEFDPGSNFLAWAATIARFEAMKFRRTRARDRHVFSDDVIAMLENEGIEEIGAREAEYRALESCIARLEPAQRELLGEAYAPGVSFHEVAARLGKSAQAFYKTIQRLRAALLVCVQRELNTAHE